MLGLLLASDPSVSNGSIVNIFCTVSNFAIWNKIYKVTQSTCFESNPSSCTHSKEQKKNSSPNYKQMPFLHGFTALGFSISPGDFLQSLLVQTAAGMLGALFLFNLCFLAHLSNSFSWEHGSFMHIWRVSSNITCITFCKILSLIQCEQDYWNFLVSYR